jgi:hypothetical protein
MAAAVSGFPALAGGVPLNVDGPPPAHTGGFGEPTCAACHAGEPLNTPPGALSVDGLPLTYEPGRSYRVTIELWRPELRRAGFQAAVRFADGSAMGRQAGAIEAASHSQVGVQQIGGMAYVQHTLAGAAVPSGAARWSFRWTAPAANGTVVLHVAANAANDDNSPFGDYIYTLERSSAAPRP